MNNYYICPLQIGKEHFAQFQNYIHWPTAAAKGKQVHLTILLNN